MHKVSAARTIASQPGVFPERVALFDESQARRAAAVAKPKGPNLWPKRQVTAAKPAARRLKTVDALPVADETARKFFPSY